MWALQGVRLANGDLADIVVEGDRIVDVRRGAADGVAEALTCSEKLVLPAFIDGHVHLDKALIRDELSEHDGTLRGAIDAIHERKRRYTSDDVRTRARSPTGNMTRPRSVSTFDYVSISPSASAATSTCMSTRQTMAACAPWKWSPTRHCAADTSAVYALAMCARWPPPTSSTPMA